MIFVDEKHVRLVNAKMWNNKWSQGIYNELWNSRTSEHTEKSVIEAWQPIGMLESVCVGGTKVKFCDVVALKRQLTWPPTMVGFCVVSLQKHTRNSSTSAHSKSHVLFLLIKTLISCCCHLFSSYW